MKISLYPNNDWRDDTVRLFLSEKFRKIAM